MGYNTPTSSLVARYHVQKWQSLKVAGLDTQGLSTFIIILINAYGVHEALALFWAPDGQQGTRSAQFCVLSLGRIS